jgi:predicted MFS family arabinose efflux permease
MRCSPVCANGCSRRTCRCSIESPDNELNLPHRAASTPGRRSHGLWRHRDFLLLWSAQGISAAGSRITRTALPMAAILVLDASPYELGFLAVALSLPGVLVAWVAGGWVDRHRRRPLLIATDLIRAAVLLAIPFAALRHVLSLPLLYAVAAVVGICTVLFNLADHVFITDLVSRRRLLDANGKREAADAIAEISGPALGGALVALWTAPIAIAADAVTFVVSALLISRIGKTETIRAPAATASFLADVRTGIAVVWRTPAVRTLFCAMTMFTLCGSFMASLYTLYALRELGLSPAQLGVAIGCGGMGGLVGAALAAPAAARWGTRRALLVALAMTATMQVFIPLAPATPWIAMAFLVVQQLFGDGAMTVYLVNETTLRQQLLPREALGRAAATWQVAAGLLTPAGALLGAVLAEAIGLRPTLWVLAAGFASAFLWLIFARNTLPVQSDAAPAAVALPG